MDRWTIYKKWADDKKFYLYFLIFFIAAYIFLYYKADSTRFEMVVLSFVFGFVLAGISYFVDRTHWKKGEKNPDWVFPLSLGIGLIAFGTIYFQDGPLILSLIIFIVIFVASICIFRYIIKKELIKPRK